MCTTVEALIWLKSLDKMVNFTPFAALTAQFDGIHEIIKEQHKVTRPILTTEEKERIENMLVCSLLSEEEILITYYEDSYLLTSYMRGMCSNGTKSRNKH
ncbi:YolD-like family protein [Bacillus cereus]|nr:YolD-like family protein [Bacillus cereus]